jgi:hypothetical protein
VPEVDRCDATSKSPSSKLRADATQLSGLAAPSNNRAENKSSGFLLELPPAFFGGRQVSDAAIVFAAYGRRPGHERISHAGNLGSQKKIPEWKWGRSAGSESPEI